MYKEFAADHEGDQRVRTLSKVPGGFDKAVSGWLEARSKFTTSEPLLNFITDMEPKRQSGFTLCSDVSSTGQKDSRAHQVYS